MIVTLQDRFEFLTGLAQMPFHGSGSEVQLHADIADAEPFQVVKIANDPGCRREDVQEEVDILPLEGEEGIGGAADFSSFPQFSGIGGGGGLAFIDSGMQDNGVDPIEEDPFAGVVPAEVLKHLQHAVVEGFEGLMVVGEEAFAQ